MSWRKNTLLALIGAAALAGIAVSASADDWFWAPQSGYASHDDGYRSYGHYGRSQDGDTWNRDDDNGYRGDRQYRSYSNNWNGGSYGYGYRDRGHGSYGTDGYRHNEQHFGDDRRYDPDDDD